MRYIDYIFNPKTPYDSFKKALTPLVLTNPHEVYSSITNIDWVHTQMAKPSVQAVSYSFRGAGSLIADIRNAFLNTEENYSDWYCSAPEGRLVDIVKDHMEILGWTAKF